MPLRGDPAKLRQILLNLLSNAIKFTPRGGYVWIEAKYGATGVSVTVGDSGIGMSPDDVAVALTLSAKSITGWSGAMKAPGWACL